jgi:hypothetical protein
MKRGVTPHIYPPGALRTTSELEALVDRWRNGETIQLYAPMTAFIRIYIIAGEGGRDRLLVRSKLIHGYQSDFIQPSFIRPSWWNVPLTGHPPSLRYLFSNYWLAYAYFLKITKLDD